MRPRVPRIHAFAAAGVLLLLAAGHAVAQGTHVRLTPRAGAVTPADWFYEEFRHFGIDPLEWTEAALLRAPIAGIAAELAVLDDGLWIRAELLRTLGQELSVTHAVLRPPMGYNPPEVVRTIFVLDAAVTLASVDLALPFRVRLPPGIQPYATAGIGAKHYTFDRGPLAAYETQIVPPQDGTTSVFNVGAGAVVDLFGLRLDLLARDAISTYWEKQQHDVIVTLGLSLPIRQPRAAAHATRVASEKPDIQSGN